MCHGKHWGWPLVLFAALGLTALAQGEDAAQRPAGTSATSTGNWFTRLFPGGAAKKTKAKGDSADAVAPAAAPAVSPAIVQQRAFMEWCRRLEVCDKVREVALQTNDEELRRKADQLADRAWENYRKATSGLPLSPRAPEEKILEENLGLDAVPRGPGQSSSAARKLPSQQASWKE